MKSTLPKSSQLMPKSISTILYSEWKYLLGGAIFVFVIANMQVSGLKAGIIPDLSFPYLYQNDMLFQSWLIQRVMEGWFYDNPRSGFPFGSNFLDYPGSDFANHMLFKSLGYLGGDFQSAINLYYLLSFVATFVTAYLVLRAFGLSIGLALAGAIIFDVLPFHFYRLDHGHLVYTWYFVAPILFYIGFVCFASVVDGEKKSGKRWKAVLLVLSLLLIASFGVYNALFGVIVLLTSGLAGAVAYRAWRPLIMSSICASIICAGVLINIAPNVAYRLVEGPNYEVAQRQPYESEFYGLKLVQMIMPHYGHRNKHLAEVGHKYNISFPLVNENSTASLGIIGVMGLFSMMAVILVRLAGREVDVRISLLALIVLTLFMFGTIGGLSSLFSLIVSPMIRSWNRISVFIGFGAMTGLLLLLQIGIQRYLPTPKLAMVKIAMAVALVALALWDQVPRSNLAYQKTVKQAFEADRTFVRNIEAELSQGAAIYQLPYIGFPEAPSVNQLGSYTPLTGFLHSKTLRWSSGGMNGRLGDLFFRALSQESIAKQIEIIRRLGFSGIYIDRHGYVDSGKKIVAEISAELGYGFSVEREDKQIVFFPLKNVAPVVFNGMTALEIMEYAGYVADSYGVRYKASIEEGIDFSRSGFPRFVRKVEGLSGHHEPWGRWSDENIAPVVRFDFVSDLPERFVLVLDVQVFGPNAGQAMSVKVGSSTFEVILPSNEGVLRLPIQSQSPTRFIELNPPKPISPAQLNINSDTRRLAIGFRKLRIETK